MFLYNRKLPESSEISYSLLRPSILERTFLPASSEKFVWAGGSCWSGMRRNQSEIWRSGPSCHARGRPGSTRGPPVWPMADHPLKYPRNEGVVHEKPAPGLGETREETLPQTLKEVEVGRGLGQRPSWLARKPLIRRHTQPCRDDPPPTPHAAAAPWFRAARRHSPMGVEPLRAGAQRNLGRGPQRAIGAPSGDAAGPTEIRECSLSHPQILLQSHKYLSADFTDLRRLFFTTENAKTSE